MALSDVLGALRCDLEKDDSSLWSTPPVPPHLSSGHDRFPCIKQASEFRNKSGNRGLFYDGFRFRFKKQRKTDHALIWRCCRCDCSIETNDTLQIIKQSVHRHPCIQLNTPNKTVPGLPASSVQPLPLYAIPANTGRGRDKVVIDGYLFVKKGEAQNWTRYRCSQYFKKCKSVCTVDRNLKIVRPPSCHNHWLASLGLQMT